MLVSQSIGQFIGGDISSDIQTKSGNWLNFINARYRDLPSGVEGAFLFSEDSPVNNLRVFVDDQYKEYDDLLRAMLLSHELRHVLQFLEFKATGVEVPCIEQEVQAFFTQYTSFASLTQPEQESLRDSTKTNLTEPLYWSLINMSQNAQTVQGACGGVAGGGCFNRKLTDLLTEKVSINPYYQEQRG